MAKWYHPDVLDGGLSVLDTAVTTLHLLSAYSVGDNYATVTSTNSCGSVAIAAGDITLAAEGANDRKAVVLAKTITSATPSGPTPNLHIALVDGTRVLAVTDETSDQEIFNGNDVNVPTFDCIMTQPTQ
jgi:hypothetical protein